MLYKLDLEPTQVAAWLLQHDRSPTRYPQWAASERVATVVAAATPDGPEEAWVMTHVSDLAQPRGPWGTLEARMLLYFVVPRQALLDAGLLETNPWVDG
jgi:hypothetical protein